MEVKNFGRYEVVGELGKGAMGVVYRALDPMLDRTVAIKTINMSLDSGEVAEYEARFYQEARAAGSLNHPNIVTIHDIGRSGNIAYMAMEFLEGRELRSYMTPGKALDAAQAVEIAAQVAEGLGYAHGHGVIHRDVKPANIMILGNGMAKITDFGIARLRTAEVRTQTGVVLGSPRYMSPEQVAGKRAEPRSDVFSLGVILYEMLTGKPPFTGDDVTSIMFQILNFVPPPPSSVNPAVPAVLDFIVAKALAKAADDRYREASELARDLRDSVRQIPAAEKASVTSRSAAMAKFDADAADALARSLPGERRDDAGGAEISTAPTFGLSKNFDSLAATARLAVHTGMAEMLQTIPNHIDGSPAEARALVSQMRHGQGWTRQDKIFFAASVAGATVIGAIIVFA